MWPVYTEYFLSVAWAYLMATLIVVWLVGLFMPWDLWPRIASPLLPGWHGIVLGTTCLIQFSLSKWLDGHYDRGLGRNYFWMIWYPLVYWLINIGTTTIALPQAIAHRRGKRARWVSPDRGVRA